MIIEEVKLFPFAGLNMDSPLCYDRGLNVIYGPNEAGKSTVINAILSSFFLPSKPKVNLPQFKVLDNYFPLPSGDTIRVMIKFSANGKTYKLDRTWGNDPKTELNFSNNVISSEARVNEILKDLLAYGEGTYRNVLIARQSEMERTVKELASNSEVENCVGDALRKTVFEADGISVELLGHKIKEELDGLVDHWDFDKDTPEGNRGIDNPWKQKVGKILEQYYEVETLRKLLREGKEAEVKFVRVEHEMKTTEEQISKLSEELNRLKSISADVRKRNSLDMKIKELSIEEQKFLLVSKKWPVADYEIERLSELNRGVWVDEGIKKLETQISALPQFGMDHLEAVRRLNSKLSTIDDLLSEAKLYGKIETKRAINLIVRRDEGEAESIRLESNNAYLTEAGKRISVESTEQGWSMDFHSGKRELEDINTEKGKVSKQLREILLNLSVSSVSELEESYKKAEELRKALDSKRKEIEDKIKENNRVIQQYTLEIGEWTKNYVSCDEVNTRLGEIKFNTKNVKDELNALSPLPEGMGNSEEFFNYLAVKERELESHREKQIELVKAFEEAKHNLVDSDIEEMEEQLAELQQRLYAFKKRAESLRKVKEVFERVIEDLDKNTFRPLESSFATYLSPLTANRYDIKQINSIVPAAIVKKDTGDEIGLDYLSTGTKDGVAIALRLAMAECLLSGRDGFMIMDDPLVNLDPQRKKLASSMLKEFSNRFQLIISTCDPATAELLGGNLIDVQKLV